MNHPSGMCESFVAALRRNAVIRLEDHLLISLNSVGRIKDGIDVFVYLPAMIPRFVVIRGAWLRLYPLFPVPRRLLCIG